MIAIAWAFSVGVVVPRADIASATDLCQVVSPPTDSPSVDARQRGDIVQALSLADAQIVYAQRFGSKAADLGRAQGDRAMSLVALGRFDEARAAAAEAMELQTSRFGMASPEAIEARLVVAEVADTMGQPGRAQAELRQVIAKASALACPKPWLKARAELDLAELLPAEKSERQPLARSALASITVVYGPSHWRVADAQRVLASTLPFPREQSRADDILAEALAKIEPLGGDDFRVLRIRRILALNRMMNGDTAAGPAEIEDICRRISTRVGPTNAVSIACTRDMGLALLWAGRNDEAAELTSRGFDLSKANLGVDHPTTASFLLLGGSVRAAQKQFDKSRTNFSSYGRWAAKVYGPENSQVFWAALYYAGTFSEEGKFKESVTEYLRLEKPAQSVFAKNDPYLADLYYAIGYNSGGVGRGDKVEEYLRRASNIADEAWGVDSWKTLRTRCQLAWLLVSMRRFDEGGAMLEGQYGRALKLPRRQQARSICVSKYAQFLGFARGDAKSSDKILLDEFFPAGLENTKIDDNNGQAAVALALNASQAGDLDAAERIMGQVLQSDWQVETADFTFLAAVARYIQLLSAAGRHDEVIFLTDQVFLPVYNRLRQLDFLAAFGEFVRIMPSTLTSGGDEASARAILGLLTSVLDDYSKIIANEPGLYDEVLAVTAQAATYVQEHKIAVSRTRELVDYRVKTLPPDAPLTRQAKEWLAEALIADQQPEAAEPLLKEIAPYFEKLDASDMSRLTFLVTRASAVLGRPGREADALGLVRQVLTAVDEQRLQAGRSQARLSRFQDAGRCECTFVALADADWHAAKAGVEDPAKLKLEAFAALQRGMTGPASKAVASAAARRAADERSGRLGQLASELQSLNDAWLAAELDKTRALAIGPQRSDAVAAIEAGQHDREARMAIIETTLKARYPRYFDLLRSDPVSPEEAQRMMRRDEAILIAVPTYYGVHSVVVARDGIWWHRADVPYKQLSTMIKRLRTDLEAGRETCHGSASTDAGGRRCGSYDRETAWKLYQLMVGPLADHLAGKRHVFVASADILASVPFAALVSGPSKGDDADPDALRATPWFGDAHALTQISSIRSLQLHRRFSGRGGVARQGFAGFGDPLVFGEASAKAEGGLASAPGLADVAAVRALPRIDYTAVELYRLRDALGAPPDALHLREQATETKVKTLDLSNDRVLAFATHGLVAWQAGDVSEPALVMSPPDSPTREDDGLLTAPEIATLRLNADWVILSACDTASGGWEGAPVLAGLARAFFYAGARSLLVSHWPVRDDVAADLVSQTIRRAQRDRRISRAEALQAAMRATRNSTSDSTRAHPAAWAPFVLVGDAW